MAGSVDDARLGLLVWCSFAVGLGGDVVGSWWWFGSDTVNRSFFVDGNSTLSTISGRVAQQASNRQDE